MVSQQMSQVGKEKKRRQNGLEDLELNSCLFKSVKYLCGASGRISLPGCHSQFGEVVVGAPFVVSCGAC